MSDKENMAMIFVSVKAPCIVPHSCCMDMVELIVLDIKRGQTFNCFTKLLMPPYQSKMNHAWPDIDCC